MRILNPKEVDKAIGRRMDVDVIPFQENVGVDDLMETAGEGKFPGP